MRINFVNNQIFKGNYAYSKPISPILRSKLEKEGINIKHQTPNKNTLSIYYYNDTHGNSDQIAGIFNSVNTFRRSRGNQTNFVLSAGDNCSGGDSKKNEFIFDLMQNKMKVDASAIGNHELDAAQSGFLEALEDKAMPFVATNAEFEDQKLNSLIKKSHIVEKNGVKYGFVGAMPIDFNSCTKKAVQKGITIDSFEGTIEKLQKEINNLKAQNVDRIIMLSHSGYETDKKYATNLDGVDVIVGGHSHTVVDGAKQNENLLTSKSGEPVIIVQAGENGKYHGILDIIFDDKGVIKSIKNTLTESKNREKSPTIEYVKCMKLGKSPVVGKITEIDPMPANRRIEPLGWTCVVADSMKEELSADISIINSANIRKVPKKGNLTHRDITESAPMKNDLLKTKITQKQLVDVIKNSVYKTFTGENGEPGLLQGSGFGYKADNKGNLISLYLIDKTGKRTPIDINKPSETITYTAVYDSFVAQKDGEYPELYPQYPVQKFDFDKDKTMIDYLAKFENLNNLQIKYDNRIEIIKT